MDKVSIIVPVYNVENYIEKCVNSCIEQTYTNIEVLLIDDGSSDDSLKLIKKYADVDSRIKVISQKNKGVSVARNRGIEESSGQWLVFLDGDDWLELDAIEKFINKKNELKSDIYVSSYYTNFNNNEIEDSFLIEKDSTFDKNNIIELIENCIVKNNLANLDSSTNIGVPWAKMYNKEFVIKNNLSFSVGLKRMQDMIFNIYAFNAAECITVFPALTYHYRKSLSSATNKYSPDFILTAEKILNELSCFIDNNNYSHLLKEYYNVKSLKLCMETINLQVIPQDNLSFFKFHNQIRMIFNKLYVKVPFSANKLLSGNEKIIKKLANLKFFLIISLIYKVKLIKLKKNRRDMYE